METGVPDDVGRQVVGLLEGRGRLSCHIVDLDVAVGGVRPKGRIPMVLEAGIAAPGFQNLQRRGRSDEHRPLAAGRRQVVDVTADAVAEIELAANVVLSQGREIDAGADIQAPAELFVAGARAGVVGDLTDQAAGLEVPPIRLHAPPAGKVGYWSRLLPPLMSPSGFSTATATLIPPPIGWVQRTWPWRTLIWALTP